MKQKGEVMCQSDSYVRASLSAVLNMQLATLIACAVGVLATALMNGCVCERLARIEAEAKIEPMKVMKEKGE